MCYFEVVIFSDGSLSSRQIMYSRGLERYRQAYGFNLVSLISIVYRKLAMIYRCIQI